MSKKIKVSGNHYEVNGKKYIRVTRVLDIIAKPEFYRWYAKLGFKNCERYTKRRADFGTRFHKHVQLFLSGRELNWIGMDDEMFETVNLFTDWAGKHELVPKHLEYHMIDDRYMLGGTADFIGMYDGKKLLIDWKTAKKMYSSYYLQAAAYVNMYECVSGERLDGAMFMFFRGGNVDMEIISREKLDEYFEVFLCALMLWRWKFG